jgi:hypothetical protein
MTEGFGVQSNEQQEQELPQTGAPSILVIQTEGEGVDQELQEAGWNVVHHTNNPLPWLDDAQQIASVTQILVSPLAFSNEEIVHDVYKCIQLLPTFLYVEPLTWLLLELENFVDQEDGK